VEDGVVVTATMRNHHLGIVRDTLLDPGSYSVEEGMTLFEISSELQILPTCASVLESGEIVLGYGLEGTSDGSSVLPYRYPLTIYLDTDHKVIDVVRKS